MAPSGHTRHGRIQPRARSASAGPGPGTRFSAIPTLRIWLEVLFAKSKVTLLVLRVGSRFELLVGTRACQFAVQKLVVNYLNLIWPFEVLNAIAAQGPGTLSSAGASCH